MHNLRDWAVENRVRAAQARYEVVVYWADALVPAIAVSLMPVLIILHLMS